MSFDVTLVIGVILAVLAIPAIVSAKAAGRSPRRADIVVMIAGGLIVIAATQSGDGLQFADIPRAFAEVIRSIIR